MIPTENNAGAKERSRGLLRAAFTAHLVFLMLGGRARGDEPSAADSGELPGFESTTLTPDEAAAMSQYETVVRESRPAMSAGELAIDRETISSARPASADEILRLAPGVLIVQHGAEGKGHQIFMQGFDAAHGSDVEATLMGVPLNEPSHVHGQGYLDLYGIIPEVVSEMRVQKGPFLPDQGDFAMAGSLRFDLGVPDSLRPGFTSFEVTHRGKLRAVGVIAPQAADEASFAAAEIVRDPGFGPDREARRAAVLGQLRKRISGGGAVSALISLQSARFESPETVRLSDVETGKMGFWDAYEPPGHGLSDRALVQLGYGAERGTVHFDASVYGLLRDFVLEENFTGRLLYPDAGDLRRQEQHGGAAGVITQIEKILPVKFPARLTFGLGWRFDRTFQKEVQLTEARTPWQTNRDLDFSIHQPYGFAGIRLSPARFVTLFPSVRVVSVSDIVNDRLENTRGTNTEVAVLPRLAASFPVHERVSLFADYGRGYRSPEARAATAPPPETVEDEALSQYKGGAPEITIADSVEIGLQATPVPMLELAFSGFATFLEREMVFDHVSNLNVAMDGTRRLGVTLTASLAPISWLHMDTDVTFTDARFNRSGHYVPGVPRFMGTASVRAGREKGWYGGLSLRWCGKRPLAHQATASGVAVLDASVGHRFSRVDVGLTVDNVLNSKTMEGVYHFASWFDEEEPRSLIPSIHYAAGEPVTARFFLTVIL